MNNVQREAGACGRGKSSIGTLDIVQLVAVRGPDVEGPAGINARSGGVR